MTLESKSPLMIFNKIDVPGLSDRCDTFTTLYPDAIALSARTGVGVDLSVAMFDVMADWMNMPLLQHRYCGGAPDRAGSLPPGGAPARIRWMAPSQGWRRTIFSR